ncbi:GDSL-type esterase/lipase family protein [Paenibacillus sp. FSL M7-1046]|uniref:GDSL-type esterase/lipase family protein n=1 Tax=Paenibacillus sp. FSL M7-1046 TaxID=2975315 RepID=UPI0030F675A2
MRFLDLLETGQITKIKGSGDSITVGQGAVGHNVPPSNPVIYTDGTETFREGDYTCRCWVNQFREYIPGIQFVNAGIGGKSAKWANAHKAHWVEDDEDVVFVMLGTNDRWDSANLEEFKTNLEQFLSYVKARSNLMIVMTATLTLNDSDGYYFGRREVDRVISQVCLENCYPHISHYRELLKQTNLKRTQLNSVLETSGSHPIDGGHKIIWQSLQQALGLIDSTQAWEDASDDGFLVRLSGWDVTNSTSILDFKIDKLTIHLVPNAHAEVSGFPEGKGGSLMTYKLTEKLTYSYQIYSIYQSNATYKRYWTGSIWTALVFFRSNITS